MMRLILWLVLLLLSIKAMAFECQDDGKMLSSKGEPDVNFYVNLPPRIRVDEEVTVDLEPKFTCRNTASPNAVDYMRMDAYTYQSELDSHFKSGVEINGKRYFRPISYAPMVLELRDSYWHSPPLKVFYQLKRNPRSAVVIKAGTLIAGMTLHKWSSPRVDEFNANWWIYAANDVYYTSGTCVINNGQDINVDFGQIARNQLTQSGTVTAYWREIHVPYQCKDTRSWAIKMTLSADASSFSANAIKTTNPGLGVEVYHRGRRVKPWESINSRIVNGVGGDNLTFALVKSSSVEVASGPFSASAVLVMSLQ